MAFRKFHRRVGDRWRLRELPRRLRHGRRVGRPLRAVGELATAMDDSMLARDRDAGKARLGIRLERVFWESATRIHTNYGGENLERKSRT